MVYAKSPLDGKVKTRLAKGSNTRFATQAYKRLMASTAAALAYLPNVTLAISPNLRHGYPNQLAKQFGLKTKAQPQGNLGQRMGKTMKQAASPCIIIGTDCPALTVKHIQAATQALQTADVYLLPALDGGYALVACNHYYPAIFRQVSWSTPRLLKQTLRQARAAGLMVAIGPAVSDVDQYTDWKKARKLGLVSPLWRRRNS